jgi:hypothetical protein
MAPTTSFLHILYEAMECFSTKLIVTSTSFSSRYPVFGLKLANWYFAVERA